MRVVARKGIRSVTVQDIADEAGVAKGTVYIYFQSRDEILQSAMELATERLMAKLAAACSDCRTFRRISLAMSEPLGEKRLRKHTTYQTYLAQLEKLLRDAIARGELRDAPVERLAVSISSVVRDIVLHRIIDREP